MSRLGGLRVAIGVLVAVAIIISLVALLTVRTAPAAQFKCNRGHPCAPSPSPSPTPSGTYTGGRLLFGLGPEADGAINDVMTVNAPIKMLTSWFNGHQDLSWMGAWHQSVLNWYAQGYTLHLVMYDTSADVANLATPYGPACGKPYSLSSTAVDDASALAAVFAGGPFYVTVWTEFQTNPCVDNQWVGNENYYRTLKDNYLRIMSAFHVTGGKVSLGWGGWQWSWDDPANGGGRSLFPYFADVMNASDFQSFQAMMNTGDGNIDDVPAMTGILDQYGNGMVMLAHHMPDSGACAVFNTDVHALFTDSSISSLTSKGLFAWSFMEPNCWNADPTLYTFVRDAVRRYAQ